MTCSLDQSERGSTINALLAAGRSASSIEREMRQLGAPTKRETILKHLRVCLQNKPDNALLVSSIEGKPTVENIDFAQAIRSEANRRLAAGTLTVTAAHGLKAQELLDRRAEKRMDRALMVELAGLLSGARSLHGPPSDLVIEGEWREVSSADQPLLEGVSDG
jgi:hypothetical protein